MYSVFCWTDKRTFTFSNDIVSIDHTQSLLLASGNFLTTEIVGQIVIVAYFFLFSKNINDFLLKYGHLFNPNDFNKTATVVPISLYKRQFYYPFY